jgi:hypothetical protein
MQKAARSLLGQKGCGHHDQVPRPSDPSASPDWECPACDVTVSGDAVEAFAYPEGEPRPEVAPPPQGDA